MLVILAIDEREDIKKLDELAFCLYSDLREDGHIILEIPEQERTESTRIAKYSKITIDISNKLLKTKEFKPEEQWYILLSVYCWWCEVIKNLLSLIAKKIFQSLKAKELNGFMTVGTFLKIMNEYKAGKFAQLFSDMNVDLRNSFAHGRVDFPNDEVIYYDSQGTEKKISLKDFLSQFKKLPPLYTYLFAYRLKVFREEIREFAKRSGFL